MPRLTLLDRRSAKWFFVFLLIATNARLVGAEDKLLSKTRGIELRAARDQVVRDLIRKLERTPEGPRGDIEKYETIRTLASYRAPEAASVLVREATFVMRNMGVRERHPLQVHIAAHALTKIGLPAYDAIFRRLIRPATEEELRVFAYVLCAHDGRLDPELGRYLVQRARRDDRVVERVENLDMLDAIISAPNFGDDTDWPSTKYTGEQPEEPASKE